MKQQFENLVCKPGDSGIIDSRQIADIVRRVKAKDKEAFEVLCALLVRVAFIEPESIDVVYDALTRAWLGLDDNFGGSGELRSEAGPLPSAFWENYWRLIDDSSSPMSASETTARVVALMQHLPPTFFQRAEAATIRHRGVTNPSERPIPALMTAEDLRDLPSGSLGQDLYRLLIDNKFDLEVVRRDSEVYGEMPPALRYVNVRIAQMHDVWHLAAGYTTSSLHETALAVFQLAQFGHNYGAMYIATVMYLAHAHYADAKEVLMQIIAEAWYHSRQCPSLMDIEWEQIWHLPTGTIRRQYRIPAFDSIYKDTLFEEAAALQKHLLFRSANWLALKFGCKDLLARSALDLHIWAVAREKRRSALSLGAQYASDDPSRAPDTPHR
jgi:ubiquinone biosynthesis protein Coq4